MKRQAAAERRQGAIRCGGPGPPCAKTSVALRQAIGARTRAHIIKSSFSATKTQRGVVSQATACWRGSLEC